MTEPLDDEADSLVERADPSYADKVNAPLSPETIEALRKELESGEYARFRRARKGGGKT